VFAAHVRSSDLFELVAPPSFALSVFRIAPVPVRAAVTPDELNAVNRAFHSALQTHHELLLTQTNLAGVFCLRLAVGAARTERADIEKAWGVLKAVAEDVLRQRGLEHAGDLVQKE